MLARDGVERRNREVGSAEENDAHGAQNTIAIP
jgi:hypothetical protein